MKPIVKFLQYLSIVIVIFSALSLFIKKFDSPWQHFTDQANGFLEGRLDSHFWTSQDLVEKDGKYYWPNGPFPAVLIIPFQLLFQSERGQSLAAIPLIGLLAVSSFILARQYEYSKRDAFFLSFAFHFSSMNYAILIDPKSWFFSQTVTLLFAVASMCIWKWKRSSLIVGILLACILATRPTAMFFGGIFAFSILRDKLSWKAKFRQLFLLAVPILLSMALLGWFNFARFGNALDNGYRTNNVGGTSEPLRDLGIFTPLHIPMNVYWYFFSTFTTVTDGTAHLVYPYISFSPWGLSLFLVAPFFMFTLRHSNIRQKDQRDLWIVIAPTTLLLLMYFNTGWYSFGPRYFADILPAIFLLILHCLPNRRLNVTQQNLILLSAMLNSYLLVTNTTW
jgi:hypothetical protein